MPSPFPGMDPYLEHPARWPGVHQRFITYMCEELNAQLPPGFVAEIGERLYVAQPDRSIFPDVAVWRTRTPGTSQGAAGTAQADPPWVLRVHPVEVREPFIEITLVGDQSRLVTVIEVLSHANKTGGSQGRDLYLRKQHELLQTDTHLMEIDLLRAGEHTVAAPREALLRRGTWNYLVSLHRGGFGGTEFIVWPVHVKDRLPQIDVPLLYGEKLVLELQPILDRCYDSGPYARRLDYGVEPEPPLAPNDAAWANALLRERGLRQ